MCGCMVYYEAFLYPLNGGKLPWVRFAAKKEFLGRFLVFLVIDWLIECNKTILSVQ